ncbi:hypothetical protein [Streptomyces sp. KL116D]|uniref:hypothetical protein n=1 Tax=Streptomyces sp. KL116D TaxID=3045152 RepID=UPI003557B83C
MAQRERRDAAVRLGLNYIILPESAGRDRLMDLVDFVADLNEHAPGRLPGLS